MAAEAVQAAGATAQVLCKESVSGFSAKLFQQMSQTKGNIFFSPLSIATCLQMVRIVHKGSGSWKRDYTTVVLLSIVYQLSYLLTGDLKFEPAIFKSMHVSDRPDLRCIKVQEAVLRPSVPRLWACLSFLIKTSLPTSKVFAPDTNHHKCWVFKSSINQTLCLSLEVSRMPRYSKLDKHLIFYSSPDDDSFRRACNSRPLD